MQKRFKLLIIFIILVTAYLAFVKESPEPIKEDIKNVTNVTIEQPKNVTKAFGKGRLVFAIKDKARSIDDFAKVDITITGVNIRKGDTWIAVMKEQKKFDLLELKDITALLGDIELESGTYNELRLDISSVFIIKTDGRVHDARLPSGTLKIKGDIIVEPDQTSSVVLDFLLDKSFHETGMGSVIMAPVIKLETKTGVEVEIDDTLVKIKAGKGKDRIIGMNLAGDMRLGEQIDPNAELKIENQKIKLGKEFKKERDPGEKSCEEKCDESCDTKQDKCSWNCENYAERSCIQSSTSLECEFDCIIALPKDECKEVCGLKEKACKKEYKKRCDLKCEAKVPKCTKECVAEC